MAFDPQSDSAAHHSARDAAAPGTQPFVAHSSADARPHAVNILESIVDAFVALDTDWRYTYVNQKAAQIFGRRPEDLIGTHIWTAFPEGTGQPLYDAYHRALADQTPLEIEAYYPPYDRWFESRIFPSASGLSVFFQDVTERRRAREYLRESERRLDEAQRIARLGSWEWNVQTNTVSWSRELMRIVGWEGDGPDIAQSWAVIHPDDAARVVQEVQRAVVRGGEVDFENRLLCPDGREIVVHNWGHLVRDEAGQPLRLIAVAQDMTDLRQAEAALQESQGHLQAIAEATPACIILTRMADGAVLYANPFARQLFGVAPGSDLSGYHASDFYQDPAERAETVRLLSLSPLVGPRELAVKRLDGGFIWAMGSFQRLMYRGEEAVLATHHDITERKQAEEALRGSEQRLRLALASGKLGTWEFDVTSREFTDLSDQCKAHYGLAPEAHATATELLQAVHPDDREFVRRTVLRTIEEGQDYAVEHRVVWPDGSVHWISTHGCMTFGAEGKARSVIGTTQEITGRKELEAERELRVTEAQARADRDPLTELLNHRAFQKRLADEAARAERDGTTLAVVMMDLDNFKFFNDVYGHSVGDDVLRQVAERLRSACRREDVLARYGGDEFALILPGVGDAPNSEIEAQIRSRMDGLTYRPAGQSAAIPISISAGVATFPSDGLPWQEVVSRADERLRRAKVSGSGESEADQVRSSMLNAVEDFSMLDALVTAVDNKDRYTRRHSEDVLIYSLTIARELGLTEAEQHTVAVSALLHDVGKIGVPDAILRKPGPLTDEEFAAVRQHPQMGAVIVSAAPGLEDTLGAVRHHHERWDGGGYPLGLKGEETPLIARLMAVADAFSAMTTDRPYRKGIADQEALSVLHTGAGTQWDPQCVGAFLRAHPSGARP